VRRDTPVWVKRPLHAAPGLLAALEHKLRTMPPGAEAAGAPAAAAGGTAAGVDVAGLCAEEAVRARRALPATAPSTGVPLPTLLFQLKYGVMLMGCGFPYFYLLIYFILFLFGGLGGGCQATRLVSVALPLALGPAPCSLRPTHHPTEQI
jgi:hypothetical protein